MSQPSRMPARKSVEGSELTAAERRVIAAKLRDKAAELKSFADSLAYDGRWNNLDDVEAELSKLLKVAAAIDMGKA